jgi:hypothetical protein
LEISLQCLSLTILPFLHEGHLNSVYSLVRCPHEQHVFPGNAVILSPKSKSEKIMAEKV